ncbi:hypothetical protein L3Q67_45140 (plasmid) [Saccharothrix sp. AJ9571]|nr:hypothetical protein L3Q67_45140 [Saccharothrix sp. AJ9571]
MSMTIAEYAAGFSQLDFDLLSGLTEDEFNEVFENLALLSTPVDEREHRRRLAGQGDAIRFTPRPQAGRSAQPQEVAA